MNNLAWILFVISWTIIIPLIVGYGRSSIYYDGLSYWEMWKDGMKCTLIVMGVIIFVSFNIGFLGYLAVHY